MISSIQSDAQGVIDASAKIAPNCASDASPECLGDLKKVEELLQSMNTNTLSNPNIIK